MSITCFSLSSSSGLLLVFFLPSERSAKETRKITANTASFWICKWKKLQNLGVLRNLSRRKNINWIIYLSRHHVCNQLIFWTPTTQPINRNAEMKLTPCPVDSRIITCFKQRSSQGLKSDISGWLYVWHKGFASSHPKDVREFTCGT